MRNLFFSLFLLFTAMTEASLLDNLRRANKGDYIVTAQGKSYTLLHIYDRKDNILTIEEITAPMRQIQRLKKPWKEWIMQGAPNNTAWVMYAVDLNNGKMLAYYSLTKQEMYDLSQADSFLTTLLNLKLQPIPYADRRKTGLPIQSNRPLWHPQMVVEGRPIPNVEFDAWRTQWPKDNSDLSGKEIEVYIPNENSKYPSYFPYWLEISGVIGNAKIRIVDSGSGMDSPAAPLKTR